MSAGAHPPGDDPAVGDAPGADALAPSCTLPSRAARVEAARRLGTWRPRQASAERLVRRLGTARLALALLGLPTIVWLFRSHPAWGWLAALPAAAFALLVLRHERAREALADARRAVAFHERTLRRLDGRWTDDGRDGLDLLGALPQHARDLDLFGRGSLFQLVDTTRTDLGARTLARWLAAASPPDVLRARQEAVRELVPDLDLREEFARLDAHAAEGFDDVALAAWATAPPVRLRAWERVTATLLGALALTAAWGWAFGGLGAGPLVLVVVAEAGFHAVVQRRLGDVTRGAEQAAGALDAFAGMLASIERRTFRSPRLVALRGDLRGPLGEPSAAVRRLDRLAERLVNARRGSVYAGLAFLLQLPIHAAAAVERWRARLGTDVPRWLVVAGEVEALAALAQHASEHPDHVWPEFVDGAAGPVLELSGVGHPLLPADRCVRNDLRLDAACRLIVISGSNMSGKSTLLRAVGLAVATAQAGAPVRAASARLSPLQLGTSMRIEDDLLAGASHFYAEISRLRDIVALADAGPPLLVLLDEILHGTNSSDRFAGARGVVLGLLARGALLLVTTHDLALARIVDEIGATARNAHFEDQVEGDRMSFDYRMREGVVQRGNALDLMRSLGLPV
ncbi:MAG: DNA mismatch repair protein MutS [Planctomycetes bacterium]|nr:DNA mismatch repair protein MutS [Planctomycetota bacterium]